MAITTDQLAIWRRIDPARRQLVIDARWEPISTGPTIYGHYSNGDYYCPLGLALPEVNPMPFCDQVAATLAPMRPDEDEYVVERKRLTTEAAAFITAWDRGAITPDDLRAALKAL